MGERCIWRGLQKDVAVNDNVEEKPKMNSRSTHTYGWAVMSVFEDTAMLQSKSAPSAR